ncbi:hypothetical protein [Haloprofundus halobius]|uniref:hypothetical protein n=1 Tax=Haloprofundus halobius TaxID=2876194 RepID=UPI001CC9CBA1|nr:hypothetical protein [Haloprofundus halobius]
MAESPEEESKNEHKQILIECTECPFSKVVDGDSDKMSVEVLIEHGEETGHRVIPKTIEE